MLFSAFASDFLDPSLKIYLFYLGSAFVAIAVILSIFELSKPKKIIELQQKNVTLFSFNRSINKIDEPEFPNKPPVYITVISLILWTFILITSITVFYYVINGQIPIESNASWKWIVFVLLFSAIPILVWINELIWNRRSIKKKESWTIRKTELEYQAQSIDDVFIKCYEALTVLEAKSPIKMDVPKLIKVPLRERVFTVLINQTDNGNFKIYASSDTQYATTKIDFGVNKHNINDFKQLLLLKNNNENENVAFKAKGRSNISIKDSKISGYHEIASLEDQSNLDINNTDISK